MKTCFRLLVNDPKIENVKKFLKSSFNVFYNVTTSISVQGLYLSDFKEPRCLSTEISVCFSVSGQCTSIFKRVFPHSNSYRYRSQSLNRDVKELQCFVTESFDQIRDLLKFASLFHLHYPRSYKPLLRKRASDKIKFMVGVLVSPTEKVNSGWVKAFSNRDLLKRSGDVESNPGPLCSGSLLQAESLTALTPSIRNSSSSTVTSTATATATATSTVTGTATAMDNGSSQNSSGKTKEKCDLQVMSLNLRGLGDKKKLRHLINYCYKKSNEAIDSVYLLQETHSSNLGLIKYIWRGDLKGVPRDSREQVVEEAGA